MVDSFVMDFSICDPSRESVSRETRDGKCKWKLIRTLLH